MGWVGVVKASINAMFSNSPERNSRKSAVLVRILFVKFQEMIAVRCDFSSAR